MTTPLLPGNPRQVTTRIIIANCVVIGVAIILGLYRSGNPGRYFGEGRFTTAVSCAQLLAAAWFAFQTFRVRLPIAPKRGVMSSAWLWAFIAAGFVFLSADEALEIHEHLDKSMHKILGMKQSSLTDRLDDLLVGLYGIIGMGVLWIFRAELWRFKQILWPMAGGFASLFLSVFCDAASNDDEWIKMVVNDPELVKRIGAWLSLGDGGFTLLGEGFFMASFYIAWKAATRLAASAQTQAMETPPA